MNECYVEEVDGAFFSDFTAFLSPQGDKAKKLSMRRLMNCVMVGS